MVLDRKSRPKSKKKKKKKKKADRDGLIREQYKLLHVRKPEPVQV